MAGKAVESLLSSCTRNEPASEHVITSLEHKLGVRFPDDYRVFLKRSNGCEGFIAENRYVVIWPIEQVLELNDAYCVSEFAPGLILFGSDGGETGFAFDSRSVNVPLVQVPFIGMALSEAVIKGGSFEEFLVNLRDA
jgi:hypothetical protein